MQIEQNRSVNNGDIRTDSVTGVKRNLLLLAPPVAIAGIEWFHLGHFTNVYADLGPIINTWLTIHLLQLPLFALLAVGLFTLLADYRGYAATVGRIGVVFFGVFYLSMDAIAGIAVGFLIKFGQSLPAEQQTGVAAVVQELFFHPIVGGEFSVFSVLGSLGYITSTIALGVLFSRSGVSRIPIALLLASSVFVMHPFPSGPIGMLLYFTAVTWVEVSTAIETKK